MIKKLDYIDRVDYDKLPQSFKDNRQKLTELGKQLRKLEKDKTKYQSKLSSIKTDLKELTKQYNKLYNELKPINNNYSPKCYCIEYTKGNNPTKYLNLVFAILLGYFIWSEIPKVLTLIGAILVILSSLIIFIRESQLKKQIIAPRS